MLQLNDKQINCLPPWIPRTVAVLPALSRPTIISVTFLHKEQKKKERYFKSFFF